MGDKVGVWLHPSSGKERQSVQHICMLREERGKCRAGEHGAQVWINGGGGGRLERRHVGHHVCGGWASSPSESLILMVQSVRPMHQTLEATAL